ncbi:ATP-dependent helicase [Persicobacter sp. CCB-QB2]|uniref:ATP-dependent helicase n=1 Tax=Persicobacter sp. CCB-QB2 TaxID=1561025 RepID=UPI0006A9EA8C|nr:UvrD-helicase domain-containing protein [Persicobacter sp. CCB-QB2]
MNYLDQLNPPQREGVVNTEGATMIIAGAGSGKTRVLTFRIAHLMRAHGVDPFSIMSLTFTNKAAKEMRERIEKEVGNEARNLWMGTFHSVFAKILRFECDKLGYPSNFTIYDADDTKSLIKTIVKEMQLDDKLYKPNAVYGRISNAKNSLVSWQEYLNNPMYKADDEAAKRPMLGEIYKRYVVRCFKAGAMDFDDLLFNTNVLFRDHPDVLHKYQHRFRYVLVDEFQDTNVSQYLIVKKLAAVHQNICVVGDDAQSIYAFRGANIQNILNFEKDFPDCRTIKLEQNYRSTSTIVNAANGVIAKNQGQIKKDVWTANAEGEKIDLISAASDGEEARLIAQGIFESKMQNQWHNQDFAVLYRTNAQSRSLEEALRRANLKYKIVGGLSFYQRREIKDLLAYFRIALNPNDEQAVVRSINLPKRGIGPGTVDKIRVFAAEQSVDLWTALQQCRMYLPGRAANAVDGYVTMIKAMQVDVQKYDAHEAAQKIAKASGLMRELFADKTVEGVSRYENVQELLNAVKEYVDNEENEDKSLDAFLQEVSLLTGVDQAQDDDPDVVTLMTIHMAKGLEFRHVFLTGLEEELFPSTMMMESREDLEEERRLFYVAITRAEQKLTMSYAMTRYRFGKLVNCEPSRFLEEVEPGLLNVAKKSKQVSFGNAAPGGSFDRPSGIGGGFAAGTGASGASYAKNLVQRPVPSRKPVPAHKASADFTASNPADLAEGQKVEHAKFGFGNIVQLDRQGAAPKAKVNFDNVGEKTLLLSFAKLRIVE